MSTSDPLKDTCMHPSTKGAFYKVQRSSLLQSDFQPTAHCVERHGGGGGGIRKEAH